MLNQLIVPTTTKYFDKHYLPNFFLKKVIFLISNTKPNQCDIELIVIDWASEYISIDLVGYIGFFVVKKDLYIGHEFGLKLVQGKH